VLLLDPADRVLLLQWTVPETGFTWWGTPGGGIHPGETPEAAALREVREETGLRDLTLGPCVWLRETRFTFQGRSYHQRERIYAAQVDAFEPHPDGLEDVEAGMLRDLRWWTADEIERSSDLFGPRNLASLLRQLLTEGYPPEPLEL
jgi:8-oxo-dGTP pyrophosphatase MutT (NUDIX family)